MERKRNIRRARMNLCPVCGGHWHKVSGFVTCAKCGHVPDMQQIGHSGRPVEAGHVKTTMTEYRDNTLESKYPMGRRRPLTGDD